jgi:hypothetical protein
MEQFNFGNITVKISVVDNILNIIITSKDNKLSMTENFVLDRENCLNNIGDYLTTYLMPYIHYKNVDLLYRECFKIHQEKKLIK